MPRSRRRAVRRPGSGGRRRRVRQSIGRPTGGRRRPSRGCGRGATRQLRRVSPGDQNAGLSPPDDPYCVHAQAQRAPCPAHDAACANPHPGSDGGISPGEVQLDRGSAVLHDGPPARGIEERRRHGHGALDGHMPALAPARKGDRHAGGRRRGGRSRRCGRARRCGGARRCGRSRSGKHVLRVANPEAVPVEGALPRGTLTHDPGHGRGCAHAQRRRGKTGRPVGHHPQRAAVRAANGEGDVAAGCPGRPGGDRPADAGQAALGLLVHGCGAKCDGRRKVPRPMIERPPATRRSSVWPYGAAMIPRSSTTRHVRGRPGRPPGEPGGQPTRRRSRGGLASRGARPRR